MIAFDDYDPLPDSFDVLQFSCDTGIPLEEAQALLAAAREDDFLACERETERRGRYEARRSMLAQIREEFRNAH